jgi:hypothetical protein
VVALQETEHRDAPVVVVPVEIIVHGSQCGQLMIAEAIAEVMLLAS